jgi:uncharacterized membrane protein YraQ (UPF0718 family)
MDFASMAGDTFYTIAGMFWKILWALILGFAISGAIQAFVPKRSMVKVMGDDSAASLARAGFFGAISSSCSYAAAAMARSVFLRGAHITAAIAFMIAATNLVIELGFVLWSLMGWQFVVAELVGGVLLIAIMAVLMKLFCPVETFNQLREAQVEEDNENDDTPTPGIFSMAGWRQAASNFAMDWSMIWKDIVIGVVIAGTIMVWVPDSFWQALFLSGGEVTLLQMIENALIGPLVAAVSFVCSVGNVPMAAALFNGGISFGGALAFIYGDLIVIPMLLVYRQYYGTRLTLILGVILYVAMALTGFIIDVIFQAGSCAPDSAATSIGSMDFFALDYTFWLNLIFIIIGFILWRLSRQADASGHCAHHGH